MAAYFNEIDPFAAQWIRNLITAGHIAPGEVDERSIEDVTPADLKGFTQCHFFAGVAVWSYALRRAGVSDNEPLWTGSCPCQPFSAAGKGDGFADERHLWPAFHYLIEQCQPQLVLGEQVASKDAEPWLDLVQDDLEALGYAVGAVPFPAASVGAPHIRDRLYWVAGANHEGSQGRGRVSERAAECTTGEGCLVSGLADASCAGLPHGARDDGASGWHDAIRPAQPNSASSGLDHAHDTRLEGLGRGHQAEGGRIVTAGSVTEAGESGGMADAELQQRSRSASGSDVPGGRHEKPAAVAGLCGGSWPGPTNGYWRDADWLFCRDGKWRPVEPGTFPLVNGVTSGVGRVRADQERTTSLPRKDQGSRIGRLKGYGNAINAAQAEIFIRCVMECRP